MRRNVLLADCRPEELTTFVKAIHEEGIQLDCLSVISNGGRTGRFSNLNRYFKYFSTPWSAFIHRNEYNYIIGWQQFYALIFCFWCQLFHVKKKNRVIAVNYTYKKKAGFVGNIYEWFMKKCVCNDYIDYLHVPSNNYAESFSKDFGIPKEKFIVAPFGIDDKAEKYGKTAVPKEAPSAGYALAIGRSNRDYDYLIKVFEKIDFDLVIISDEYKRTNLPKNVKLINDVSGERQYPWIANCEIMIIPIADTNICSGDTVLLTAMSLGRTIFVTSPSTLSEMYVVDGLDSIYINKSVDETRERIVSYLNNTNNSSIGENARNTFVNKYSRYIMGKNISRYIR